MLFRRKNAPATFWRAFFVFNFLAVAAFGAAPAKQPELAQVGKPDADQAREILAQFRKSGIPGKYYLEFELHALPRRGQETVYQGKLWGDRNDDGAITRVELTDAKGQVRRLLVQNGEKPAVWRFADGATAQLGVASTFEPVVPGVEITAFDLQMPFLYWPDATLERVARVRGRPTNAFLFRAPAAFASQHAEVSAARAYLDGQYNALLQTELIDAQNRVVKTMALVDLKKVDEQWIPKSFDVRNEVSRDKTRFVVTAAALNLDLAGTVFAPATLAESVRPPAAGRMVRLEQ
jgi:hypothetical protein